MGAPINRVGSGGTAKMSPVSLSHALGSITRRLRDDLRTRFPDIEVEVVEEPGSLAWLVRDGTDLWGVAGTWVDPGDDLSDADVEEVLVSVAEEVADNLWPDELTDPWPPCPAHGEQPLHPRLIRGRACWACLHDDAVAVVIGSLGSG